jgi:hypothetical protein
MELMEYLKGLYGGLPERVRGLVVVIAIMAVIAIVWLLLAYGIDLTGLIDSLRSDK